MGSLNYQEERRVLALDAAVRLHAGRLQRTANMMSTEIVERANKEVLQSAAIFDHWIRTGNVHI